MPDAVDDEEMTPLVDANFPRVDLVGKAANGFRFLIAKQDQGSRGLIDPEQVRALIGKSEPDETGGSVTLSGSPAAIAKLIHEAAVAKAEMSGKAINDLPDSAFAYIEPGGTKDEGGKTTPRSKRHFPVHDEAHARNALARAPQSPFGDKAMPKIRAAAKKFGIEVSKKEAADVDTAAVADVAKDAVIGVDPGLLDPELDAGSDGMDPTVPFAEPDSDDAPGDPTEPGSPAWEAIDAATAQKWLAIAARLNNALGLLADRETLEAASGADPDDIENAWDLQDAQCAVNYAIEQLAVFAAGEQAEAELGSEMDAIGKALAGAEPSVTVVEGLTAVAKAGRVLSTANEQLIREAAGNLQRVLATLPDPVEKEVGQSAADTKEGAMAQPETSADAAAESGQEPGMGIAKADTEKAPMQAVFDQNGNLCGVVDPAQIQPVTGASSSDDDSDGDSDGATDAAGDDSQPEPNDSPAGDDLTPEDPAEAGTPADGVTKADHDDTAEPADDVITISRTVLKSAVAEAVSEALAAQSAGHEGVVAKMAADSAGLADEVETLKARLETVENTPAAPKVMARGQVPPRDQLRGQDTGTQPIDVSKALARKQELYTAPAADQARLSREMQADAVAALAAMHAAGPGNNSR